MLVTPEVSDPVGSSPAAFVVPVGQATHALHIGVLTTQAHPSNARPIVEAFLVQEARLH